mmetsp:Transcript_108045/g.345037  ORF Transcript_108045/g.345037 Transcript_108045/m.345037 type:complete len:677 (-) Transcript_108045:63-2093(-)
MAFRRTSCWLFASALFIFSGGSSAIDCPLPVSAGRSYRWPQTNPALVAPVMIVHDYQPYRQPMEAENTGDGISITVPPDFFAGFNLSDAQGASQDQYVLRNVVIRKPGRVAEGASQVLSHVLEVVLLHQNMKGSQGDWSSVVVPFSVEVGAPPDMISALLAGSRLPDRYGEREPLLLGTAQALDLSVAFTNATFLTYWTSLPTKCAGTQRFVRQFMRNASLVTSPPAFDAVLQALAKDPSAPPILSPDLAWLTGSCPAHGGAACAPLPAVDMSQELLQAQTLQSQAVDSIRAAKSTMDAALIALQNVSDESYQNAVKARENLEGVSAMLDSTTQHVDQLEAWTLQAQSATWPAEAPTTVGAAPVAAAAPAPAAAGNSTSGAALLSTARLHQQRAAGGAAQGDCLALGRSPVAISSTDVTHAQATWKASRTPISFGQGAAPANAPVKPLQLFNTGEYLRVVVPLGAGSLLGTITRGGVPLEVAFADIHVPGEHTIDGMSSAAEVQIVHLPKGGGPAVAVALRLQEGGEGSAYDNPWVASLLAALPPARSEAPVQAPADGVRGLHAAVASGEAERYFRYDGTLTRSPCRTSEWFVLEEPGSISSRQLALLRAALPGAAPQGGRPSGPFRPVSFIAEGVQDLPAATTASAAGGPTTRGAGRLAGLLGKWSAQNRALHAL